MFGLGREAGTDNGGTVCRPYLLVPIMVLSGKRRLATGSLKIVSPRLAQLRLSPPRPVNGQFGFGARLAATRRGGLQL